MNYSKTLLSAIVATVLLAGCNQSPSTAPATADNTTPAADTASMPASETAPPQDAQPEPAANEPAPAPAAPIAQQPAAPAPPMASAPPPPRNAPPPRYQPVPPPIIIPVPVDRPGHRGGDGDNDFYRSAIAGGEKEIQASRLALSHSRNPDVKRLANTLIRDHVAVDARLASLSRMRNVPPQDGAALRQLGTMFGPQFDNRYLSILLSDHRDAIALFNNASRNANTGEARNLAGNTLPKLRGHLADVQRTQAALQRNPPSRKHPHR